MSDKGREMKAEYKSPHRSKRKSRRYIFVVTSLILIIALLFGNAAYRAAKEKYLLYNYPLKYEEYVMPYQPVIELRNKKKYLTKVDPTRSKINLHIRVTSLQLTCSLSNRMEMEPYF